MNCRDKNAADCKFSGWLTRWHPSVRPSLRPSVQVCDSQAGATAVRDKMGDSSGQGRKGGREEENPLSFQRCTTRFNSKGQPTYIQGWAKMVPWFCECCSCCYLLLLPQILTTLEWYCSPPQYRGGLKGGPQVWWILFLLFLASSALKNSRNLVPIFFANPVDRKIVSIHH